MVFSEVSPKLAVYYHVVQFQGVSLGEVMDRTRKEYGGPVLFGEDLMKIEVGDSVKVMHGHQLDGTRVRLGASSGQT